MAKILVVDDKPLNREVLVTLLAYLDHEMLEASDGATAIETVRQTHPDLVITDVLMPCMDGYEFVRQLRADPDIASTRVIFYSAKYDERESRELARKAGVMHCLSKPADPETILKVVDLSLGTVSPVSGMAASDVFDREHLRLVTDKLAHKVDELETVTQKFAALLELGQQLGLEHDPQRLLERYCQGARTIIGAEYAAIAIFSEDTPDSNGSQLIKYIANGFDVVTAGRLDYTPGDLQQLFQKALELRCFRLQDLDRQPESAYLPASHPPVNSLIVSVIASPNHRFGLIYLANKLGTAEFGEEDERVATALAGKLAVAYENTKLYEELKQRAVALEREVQERKKAEEARAKLLILEQAARRRVEQHYQEAEQANRAKDEFLAVVSHELRTPMNVIFGWLELLRDEVHSDDEREEIVDILYRNACAQIHLIDDLLDVSRIITGKLPMKMESVNLTEIVKVAIDSLRVAAKTRNIELVLSIPEVNIQLQGDADRLRQAIWNLVGNAIKFSNNDDRVEVQLRKLNDSVELKVSDYGLGIEPGFLPHLFERFRQEDGSMTRRYGGLGLGLAIVRHIVDQHEGQIKAESHGRGKGSTFTLILPLPNENRSQRDKTSMIKHEDPNSSYVLEDVHVLVVDDEPDTRLLLSTLLKRAGARVSLAKSSGEAFEMFSRQRPDVLLSDIAMPGMDGFELLRRIRSFEEAHGSHTPAAALTAHAGSKEKEYAFTAGFEEYLPKPVEPKRLIEITALLAGKKATSTEQV